PTVRTEWPDNRGHDIRCGHFFLLAVCPPAVFGPALAGELPSRAGECVAAAIQSVGTRLDGTPGSGSAASFENGGGQVGCDSAPAAERSRAGDPVRMCLVAIRRQWP
ncbi:MAG: hypothetical protein ACREDH_06030, partial [Methylocella sp.]